MLTIEILFLWFREENINVLAQIENFFLCHEVEGEEEEPLQRFEYLSIRSIWVSNLIFISMQSF